MSNLHDSNAPAGVMGQFPQDVMTRDTGVSTAPDLREPASPGGSGYTINPSTTGHRLPSRHPAHDDSVSAAKHAAETLKEDTPQTSIGKAEDGT